MKMTREDFEKMYYTNTNVEMAKKLDISVNYIQQLVIKHGIPKKGKSFRLNKKVEIIE